MTEGTLELTPMIGVSGGDLQDAVRAEVARILKETNGDELAQSKLLIEMLREGGLLADTDVEVVSRLSEIHHEASAEKRSASEAYFESRELYNGMLARGKSSPVALALASCSVGSYEITEDPDVSGGVVITATKRTWEDRGALIGAYVGGRLGGGDGAIIGAAIGGAVGKAVDKCLD
jgi:hypothetical protein